MHASCPLARSFILAAITSLAAVVLAIGVATAETRLAPLEPMPAGVDSEVEEPYSATVALALPVLATGASTAVFIAGSAGEGDAVDLIGLVGMAVSPSLGHMYTSDWRRVAIGTGLRLGGGVAIVGAVAVSFANTDLEDGDGDEGEIPAVLLGTAGLIGIVGGTIYSIADAPLSAKRANEKARQITLMPAPMRGPSQSTGWGAQMQMTF